MTEPTDAEPQPTGPQPGAPQPDAQAPPTSREGFVAPSRPSNWPLVIGIIAIVFGALGSLTYLWGAVAPFVMESLMAAAGEASQAQAQAMAQVKIPTVASAVINLALAVVLLVAGIQLIRRRAGARPMFVWWALLRMIAVVFGLVVSYLTFQAQMDVMAQQGSAGAAQSMQQGIMIFSLAFGLIWGWALPIFALIWFNRAKVQDEIATWQL